MKRKAAISWGLVPITLLVLGMSACAEYKDPTHKVKDPLTVEDLSDGRKKITLTQSAHDRLAITTVPMERINKRLRVHSDAVLVDVDGAFWVYVQPEPLVFVRERVTLDRYVGVRALLTDGPAAGTPVVLEGVMELYGVEYGIK